MMNHIPICLFTTQYFYLQTTCSATFSSSIQRSCHSFARTVLLLGFIRCKRTFIIRDRQPGFHHRKIINRLATSLSDFRYSIEPSDCTFVFRLLRRNKYLSILLITARTPSATFALRLSPLFNLFSLNATRVFHHCSQIVSYCNAVIITRFPPVINVPSLPMTRVVNCTKQIAIYNSHRYYYTINL